MTDDELRALAERAMPSGASLAGDRLRDAVSSAVIISLLDRLAAAEQGDRTRTLLDEEETRFVLNTLSRDAGPVRAAAIQEKLLHSVPSRVADVSVAVNGKTVGSVRLRVDATEAEARTALGSEEMVLALARAHQPGQYDKKFIYVPGKIINIVAGS